MKQQQLNTQTPKSYLIELSVDFLHSLAPPDFGRWLLELGVGGVFVGVVKRTIASFLGALSTQTAKACLAVNWAIKGNNYVG